MSEKCSGHNNLILSNQADNVNGRFIREEGYLVSGIIETQTVTDNFNTKGSLLTVNIKKVFDSVSLNFLLTVLEKYRFHPDFPKRIAILLKPITMRYK